MTRLLLLAGAAFTIVTVAALTGLTNPVDRAARLNAWLTNDTLDEVLKLVERPGQRVLVLPVLFMATGYLSWRLRIWRPVAAAVVAVVLVNVTVGLVKWWSDRATPRLGGPGFFNDHADRVLGAYPSGHATNVGMWAVLTWFLAAYAMPKVRRGLRGTATAWVVVIIACSWARTTHWVTDLLGGVALGAACSCVGLLLASRLPAAPEPSSGSATSRAERAA